MANYINFLTLALIILACSSGSDDPVANCTTKYLTTVDYKHENANPVVEKFYYNDQKLLSRTTTTDMAWYNLSLHYQNERLSSVDLEAHSSIAFTFEFNYSPSGAIDYITRKNPTKKIFDSSFFNYDAGGKVIKRTQYTLNSASEKLELFSIEAFEYNGSNAKKQTINIYSQGNLISTTSSNFEFDMKTQAYPKEYITFLSYTQKIIFGENNRTRLETLDSNGNTSYFQTYIFQYDKHNYPTQEIIKRDNNNVVRTSDFSYSCDPPTQ